MLLPKCSGPGRIRHSPSASSGLHTLTPAQGSNLGCDNTPESGAALCLLRQVGKLESGHDATVGAVLKGKEKGSRD